QRTMPDDIAKWHDSASRTLETHRIMLAAALLSLTLLVFGRVVFRFVVPADAEEARPEASPVFLGLLGRRNGMSGRGGGGGGTLGRRSEGRRRRRHDGRVEVERSWPLLVDTQDTRHLLEHPVRRVHIAVRGRLGPAREVLG